MPRAGQADADGHRAPGGSRPGSCPMVRPEVASGHQQPRSLWRRSFSAFISSFQKFFRLPGYDLRFPL